MSAQTSLPRENAPRAEVGSVQNLTKGLQDVSLDENQSEPGEEVPDELYIQYGMRFIRDGEYRIRGSPTPAYGLVAYLVPERLLPTRKKLGDFFEMVFIKTGRADLQKLHCIECRSVFSSPTELGTHLRYKKTHRKRPGYLQFLRGEVVKQAVKQEVKQEVIEYKEASFKEIDKRFRKNFNSDDVVHQKMVDYYAACMVMRTIGEMTEEGAKRKKENVARKEENRIRQIRESKTKTKKKNAKKKKKQKGTMAPEMNEANNNTSRAYDDNDGTTPKDSAADSQEESKQGHAQRKPRRNKSKKKKGNAAASNALQEHDSRYEE